MKPIPKKCKKCLKNDRFQNRTVCLPCINKEERLKKKARLEKKKEKHKTTKVYSKKIAKTLQNKNDKLYQEIGRARNEKNGCMLCGGIYSCLHHFVLKSQSLNTRYNFDNGIPICVECHCSIHAGQNSELTGNIIRMKGIEWYDEIIRRKKVIIIDKLKFLQEQNEILKKLLNKNE